MLKKRYRFRVKSARIMRIKTERKNKYRENSILNKFPFKGNERNELRFRRVSVTSKVSEIL